MAGLGWACLDSIRRQWGSFHCGSWKILGRSGWPVHVRLAQDGKERLPGPRRGNDGGGDQHKHDAPPSGAAEASLFQAPNSIGRSPIRAAAISRDAQQFVFTETARVPADSARRR